MIEEIEKKKMELRRTVDAYGLNAKVTIKCSQDLDKLIITYQSSVLKAAVG